MGAWHKFGTNTDGNCSFYLYDRLSGEYAIALRRERGSSGYSIMLEGVSVDDLRKIAQIINDELWNHDSKGTSPASSAKDPYALDPAGAAEHPGVMINGSVGLWALIRPEELEALKKDAEAFRALRKSINESN